MPKPRPAMRAAESKQKVVGRIQHFAIVCEFRRQSIWNPFWFVAMLRLGSGVYPSARI